MPGKKQLFQRDPEEVVGKELDEVLQKFEEELGNIE